MSPPQISVLLPVRNGARWLADALKSVLSQSYSSFELLVIDDGSTDESASIAMTTGDARVRLLSSSGRGVAAALNVGLRASSGSYIARQDADDLSLADRFARQAALLDSDPSLDVVASRVSFIDEASRPHRDEWTEAVAAQWEVALDPPSLASLLPLTCCLVHGSVMARRNVLLSVDGYREDLTVAQDYDLWLRLLPAHRFARLPERLYAFRVHPGQLSAAAREIQSLTAIGAKLRYLRRATHLPGTPRATIVGEGRGAELYRRAFAEQPFSIVAAQDSWDVAAFTQFGTLAADMDRFEAGRPPLARIGNFLVRSGA